LKEDSIEKWKYEKINVKVLLYIVWFGRKLDELKKLK